MEFFVEKKKKEICITFHDDYPYGFDEAMQDNEEIKVKYLCATE